MPEILRSVSLQCVLFDAKDCNEFREDFDRPRDCWDIKKAETHSADGVYKIYVSRNPKYLCADTPINVYCDMTSQGGGWTVCITTYCFTSIIMITVTYFPLETTLRTKFWTNFRIYYC